MRALVPAVLLAAAAVAVVLLFSSVPPGEALMRALTVLVITCPCALGIATPLARVAAIAKAREAGILIRNPAALEGVDGLKAVIFDKTGTVTEGKYALREIMYPEGAENEALARVGCAEAKSGHFLAREIVRAARERQIEIDEPLSFEPIEGMGLIALTRFGEVIVGNRQLMSQYGLYFPEEIGQRARSHEVSGNTVVFFAWSGSVKGFFAFGDRIKEEAAAVVSRLRDDGISVWIVSGDSEETTRAVAQELGVENFAGQALPKDKVEIIRKLQENGDKVAMAGDGINDAAALAGSDIGITVGAGANLIRESSDVTVFGDDLGKIIEVLDLSRLAYKITRQNLFFAFFYNLLGIPLAAAGVLNPLIAVFAMFAGSITVISNTLRISKAGLRSWAGAGPSQQNP